MHLLFPDTLVLKMPEHGCNGQNNLIKNKSLMMSPALLARGGVSSRLAPSLALLHVGSTGEGHGTGLGACKVPVHAPWACTLILPPRIPARPSSVPLFPLLLRLPRHREQRHY